MAKNRIAKKSAIESIEKIENMVKLVRYDYDRAKRRHEKICINDIFINSLIAHTRDLINNGYSFQNRVSYPALYAMSNDVKMKKRHVVLIINDIEDMVAFIKNNYICATSYHRKIWINGTYINSLIAHVRELIICGYAPSNRGQYPALYEMEDNLPE